MHHKHPHKKYMQTAQMASEDDLLTGAPKEESQEQPSEAKDISEQCREQICPTCPEKAQVDEERLRALAEMENFKKRLAREHEEQLRYAAEKVLADLLPTLDNLDLALQYGSQHEACKDMLMGVEMTRKLLLDAVQKHGLEPVGAVGEVFTPELHEALSFDMRDDMDAGLVSGVFQRGYKLKDRLLRPAKVTISTRS